MFRLFVSLVLGSPSLALVPSPPIGSGARATSSPWTRRAASIENGAVAVRGESHRGRGHARRNRSATSRPQQRLDRPECLIAPGLINTHAHAAMSLLRGIADDLRLQDWLEKFIFPAEAKNVTPEFVRWGTRLACLEMALSGVTTYADMYYFEDVVAEATKEVGLRGVLGETIIGFPVPDAKTPADALAGAERFLQRFRNDPLIVPRRRAARALHQFRRDAEGVPRAGQPLRQCR